MPRTTAVARVIGVSRRKYANIVADATDNGMQMPETSVGEAALAWHLPQRHLKLRDATVARLRKPLGDDLTGAGNRFERGTG